MLRCSISQLVGYLRGRLLRITQVLIRQLQSLFRQIAKNSIIEGLFKTPFELILIQSYRTGNLGKIGRTVQPLIDQVPYRDELFLISLVLYKDFLSAVSSFASLGGQD